MSTSLEFTSSSLLSTVGRLGGVVPGQVAGTGTTGAGTGTGPAGPGTGTSTGVSVNGTSSGSTGGTTTGPSGRLLH